MSANLSTRVFDSVFEMLPNEANPSPLVRINTLHPLAAEIAAGTSTFELFAKLEWMNPFGSVKDRAASYLIRELEAKGAIWPDKADKKGRGIVEPTSGNTGISLAAMASVKGVHMRAIVPEKVPEEKKVMLRIAGADVDVLTDAMCPSPGMGEGALGMARSYAKAQGDRYVMPNQYENHANVQAHIDTTGPEIWRQTGGKITHFFTSLGTCGTVTGVATFLKAKNKNIKIIAVQPSAGHDVPGIRNKDELHVTKLFDASLIDEIIEVPFEKAYTSALGLCQREGLFAGPSSGLIFEGARMVLQRDKPAQGLGVAIFCDNVFKYISSMTKHLPALAGEP
ncbi:cysteine synthase [Phycisphaerae bacterium]|nr:cysteine synthase [Phycisphaerae bacterium]